MRACQCAFCRAHAARCTSDPDGSVRFSFAQPDQRVRYRFALRTADFLLCRTCGVYVGAVIDTPRGSFAIVNLNALVEPVATAGSEPMRYDDESERDRVSRREKRWTPVIEGTDAAAP